MRILSTVVLVVIASAPQAFAQSELPRAQIGVGAALPESDASSRMRLGKDTSPLIYWGEISARVAPRLAIGAEAIDFGTATGETRGASFRSAGEQRERGVVGLLRVRAAGGARVGVDLVGGAGVLFQRHTRMEAPCFNGCTVALTAEYTHRAPLFMAGADVPIRLSRHFSVAAVGRYFSMRRGDNTPDDPRQPIAWQFEHESSGRVGVGGSIRVTW